MIDELLRGPSRYTAMSQLPRMCFGKDLLLFHRDLGMTGGKLQHNAVKFGMGGLEIADGQTETVDQRQLLLNGLRAMHVLAVFGIVPILEGFLDQMATVGGRVDLRRPR